MWYVQAQTASLIYQYNCEAYLLNLIDTPGHVDFSYHFRWSPSAVNGAVLLKNAAQGIQVLQLCIDLSGHVL